MKSILLLHSIVYNTEQSHHYSASIPLSASFLQLLIFGYILLLPLAWWRFYHPLLWGLLSQLDHPPFLSSKETNSTLLRPQQGFFLFLSFSETKKPSPNQLFQFRQ